MGKNIILLITTIIVLSVANAQEPFNAFWKSRESRKNEAQKWLGGFKKLDVQIPTLSPTEEGWIKSEIDDEVSRTGTYTKRALDAMDSKEYDVHVTKPHLAYVVAVLSQLSEMTLDFPDQTQEVKLWARLAWLLIDPDFWQSIHSLIHRGIVDKEINGVESNYFYTYTLWARYILNEILIAHLDGKLAR